MALSTAKGSGGALVRPQYGPKPPAKAPKAPRSSPPIAQKKGK